MIKFALYLSLILYPLQNLQINIKSTAFDISSILLSIVVITFFFFSKKKNDIVIPIIVFFIIYQLLIFINSPAPTSRFLAALFWMTIILMMFYIGEDFKIDYLICEKILITILFISCLICWYQYFIIITPEKYNLGIKFRVDAFFQEPSYAGLSFYAASLASMIKFFYDEKKLKYFLLFLIFFSTAILTLSMHIVTFFLTMILIYTITAFKRDFDFVKKILLFLVSLLIFLCIIYLTVHIIDKNFLENLLTHYFKRINIFDLETKSLSLLSWLRGFEQMLYSLRETYIFGHGLGSTGEFYFPSIYGEKLTDFGVFELTLKDAFSLFFRLVIEVGFLLTLILLVLIFTIMKNVLRETIKNKKNFNECIFIFVFAIVIFVGSLLKEPNYARSSLFVAMLFLSSFIKKGKKN